MGFWSSWRFHRPVGLLEMSPEPVAVRQMLCRNGPRPFPEGLGSLGRGSLWKLGNAAAVDGLQIKVSVSIESVTRTNIHPKINFLLFLFL